MHGRLLVALAHVQAGNAWKLLNKIRQIVYSLYQAKEITKKAYNYILNSVKVSYKMDTIFTNSKNSKTSQPHRLLLNLADKINLKRNDRYADLPNLSMYFKRKNHTKSHTKTINSKYQLQHGWKIRYTWWIVFCIRYLRLFWIYLKKRRRKDWSSLKNVRK